MVWCNYLITNLSTMKKLSVFVSLSLMLSSLSWAEKYEYVRLKKNDEFSLNSGDTARLVAISPTRYSDSFTFSIGGDSFTFSGSDKTNLLVGPGTVTSRADQSLLIFAIQRASDTGSKTLAWNGSEWEGSDDSQLADNNSNNSSPVPDPSGIKYDQLLGWCYFTDTPWIYSYTNGSWYYMRSMQNGIYVWNANLPNDGWMKLHG
jgi:hypothetical protein